ncbi:MAG: hypothetical protein B7Z61_02110 [Acidobacteria bacterium 37-71-11]|nr:MAG: hypothetical protein B7Z61_02110 [Acidobacteria bacterium 37-71-11]
MDVKVAVWLSLLRNGLVQVRVMLAVDVPLLVFHRFVRMVVDVPLGEAEPSVESHQRPATASRQLVRSPVFHTGGHTRSGDKGHQH